MKQPVERRLAAILAADAAGYSRLKGADEDSAAALGRRGDLDGAEAALAESLKLKPDKNSLAALRTSLWDLPRILGAVGEDGCRGPAARQSPRRITASRNHQTGGGCISKPAGRPERRAASAGGNDGSQRLASKRQPLTLSASRETT